MHPIIQEMVNSLVGDILTNSASVPQHLLQKAIVLHEAIQGIKVDFDKFSVMHKALPFVEPEDYREMQILILLDKKIPAIKVYRQIAANNKAEFSLIFAKNVVENYAYFNQPRM